MSLWVVYDSEFFGQYVIMIPENTQTSFSILKTSFNFLKNPFVDLRNFTVAIINGDNQNLNTWKPP